MTRASTPASRRAVSRAPFVRDVGLDGGGHPDRPLFASRRQGFTCAPARHPVTHDVAVVAFYVGGSARIEQQGTWNVVAGDLMIVPAGEPHRMLACDGADVWGLGFCVPCFAPGFSDGRSDGTAPALLAPFDRVRGGASPVVRIADDRRPFLESLMRELSATTAGGDALVQRSLLTLVLHEVARAHHSAGDANDGDDDKAGGSEGTSDVVSGALRFIERNCLAPLSLDDVAAAVQRTPSYVTTALSRATGKSAGAWIIAGRMAEARRRLLHSDEFVEVIAERVGYADATHFTRLFRRTHGVTPAAWRQAQRTT